MNKDGFDNTAFARFKHKYVPDEFARYCDVRQNNFAATVQAFSHVWKVFMLVDDLIQRELNLCSTITNPAHIEPFMLATHVHAQLRVCIGLAFEGSLKEAGSVMRGAIESAAFANKLYNEPDKAKIWMDGCHGKAQKVAYEKAFKQRRKEKMFSGNPNLGALYKYWCVFSEESSHTGVRDVARRIQLQQTETHLNWSFEYFETNPKILGPSLFALLDATVLIERVLFAIFCDRLQLVPEVGENRELLVRYFEQVRGEVTAEFSLGTNRGI